MAGPIPVLICPVRSRFDILERMLKSIDYPIEQIVIVDNSCTGYEVPVDIEARMPIDYIRPLTGLGYGGGINAGIIQTPRAPYWMWTSNDVVFGPGDLENIAELAEENVSIPAFISYGFVYAAVTRPTIDKIGLVDDNNFISIYMDDIDYYRRLRLGNVKIIDYLGGIQHGADGHTASLTILSDPAHRAQNDKTHPANNRRYIEKWGGPSGHETFDTPFNSGMPLWVTKVDMDRRAQYQW